MITKETVISIIASMQQVLIAMEQKKMVSHRDPFWGNWYLSYGLTTFHLFGIYCFRSDSMFQFEGLEHLVLMKMY